jgi:hypothetical protein
VLTKEETLALVKRGDLGRACHVYMLLALLDRGNIGQAIKLPVKDVATFLGCSYSRAKIIRQRAVRYNLVQLIGRSDCRRCPVSAWRRIPVQGIQYQSQNGTQYESEVGTQSEAEGHESSPEAPGHESSPRDGVELCPRDRPKTLRGLKEETKDRPPATSHESSPAEPAPDLSSESIPPTAKDPHKLHAWSRPFARQVCERLTIPDNDAPAIAAECRRLAKTHPGFDEDPDAAKASVEALVQHMGTEAAFRDGGQLTGALRNRWAEWTAGSGGKEREAWQAPPEHEDGLDQGEARERIKQIRDKPRISTAPDAEPERPPLVNDYTTTPEPITVAEAMALAGLPVGPQPQTGEMQGDDAAQPPSEAQKPRTQRGRGAPLSDAEAAALVELLAAARAAPADGPVAANAVRVADGRIALAMWRQPDGREGIFMQCKGTRAPQLRRLQTWAAAAWPALGVDAYEVSVNGNTRSALTKEAVEL